MAREFHEATSGLQAGLPTTGGDATVTFEVRTNDGAGVVGITGDVTAASEPELEQAFAQAAVGARVIALDFAGLEYMNSGGIGLLVTLLVRANRQRQRLVAFGLNDHYRQIFSLTRLDEAIGLYDTEDEALAARVAR